MRLGLSASFAVILGSAAVLTSPVGTTALRGDGHALAVPLAADSTDDGPYVYWVNRSNAIVFHRCDGGLEVRRFRVSRTLRFDGFCGDSVVAYAIPSETPRVQPSRFDNVPKILTVSDIHGEYDALVSILQNAGVISGTLHWIWGRGHLVVLGDVFDRGSGVTESLWLIHRLESEAADAGGRVHFVLGNHELMVLRGDLRYVNAKYLDGIVRATRVTYDDLYGPDMELGRWLRSKHTAIRLNGILFVHAGIGPALVERGMKLDALNDAVRASLDLRSYALVFSDTASFLFGSEGPFWYRGYHYAMEGRYPRASPEDVAAVLDFYNATAVVVGHTEIEQVLSLYDGRVIGVDVPVEELGGLQALLWEGGRFSRVTVAGAIEPLETGSPTVP